MLDWAAMTALPVLIRRPAAIVGVLVAIAVAGCTDEGQPASTAPILSTTTSMAPTTTVELPDPSTTVTTVAVTTSTVPPTTTVPLAELGLDLVRVAEDLDAPVLLIADPDGGPDLVVEQPGRIVRLDRDRTVVLDISGDVIYGGEQGLLGLAFHPEFVDRRLAYVNYIGDGRRTVIEEFVVDGDGRFDLGSRTRILEIDQPASNHNGGMMGSSTRLDRSRSSDNPPPIINPSTGPGTYDVDRSFKLSLKQGYSQRFNTAPRKGLASTSDSPGPIYELGHSYKYGVDKGISISFNADKRRV